MEGYKKYKTIHRIAYILFFSYLFILSLGKFTFGLHIDHVAYLILIPFIAYCAIAISMEIMIRKEIAIKKTEQKKHKEIEDQEYKGQGITVLS